MINSAKRQTFLKTPSSRTPRSSVRALGAILGLMVLSLSLQAQSTTLPSILQGVDLTTGQKRVLDQDQLQGTKGTVIVFLSAKCPCSASHEPVLRKLADDFGPKGFRFIGIHSNADENVSVAEAHFEHSGLPFPVIQDHECKLANEFGALKTPHAYLFGPTGKLLYFGGVDETHFAATARKHYLRDALSAIVLGHAPPERETRVLGCIIQRP